MTRSRAEQKVSMRISASGKFVARPTLVTAGFCALTVCVVKGRARVELVVSRILHFRGSRLCLMPSKGSAYVGLRDQSWKEGCAKLWCAGPCWVNGLGSCKSSSQGPVRCGSSVHQPVRGKSLMCGPIGRESSRRGQHASLLSGGSGSRVRWESWVV
jgi:hypothetical protein